MGKKYIQISTYLIEDLIYGRLRPATSDAPEGMKIICMSHPHSSSGFDYTVIDVTVENESFEEIAPHIEMPMLEVTFTKVSDDATRGLVKQLREISNNLKNFKAIDDKQSVTLKIAADQIEDMFVEIDRQAKEITGYMIRDIECNKNCE